MRNTEIMLNMPKSIIISSIYLFNYNRIEAIGRTTEWHEGHSKFEVWRKNNANERQILQELNQANQELKILRHERLKQLYQTEME